MNCNNKEMEATLYYLYMMADGGVSYSEDKIFCNLCKELEIQNTDRLEIVKNCKAFGKETNDIFSVIVRKKIDDEVGQSFFGLQDKSALARIIWNLINLGYADTVYSDTEKKIVNYLVDKWSVDREVLQEFLDIADTMLASVKHKEWIRTTYSTGNDRDKKEKETDDEIKMLLEDVKLTIQELTI